MSLLDRFVVRVDVAGPSMAPTLFPGDRVTAIRRWRRVRSGDVVVVRDPHDAGRLLVKRVARVNGDGIEVRGDNPDLSRDSRDFGSLRSDDVRFLVLRSSLRQ